MIDYHVHLWPHDERADDAGLRLENLARYCERARAAGVREIALTEHLFRFTQAADLVAGVYRGAAATPLGVSMARYFDFHGTADLDTYVREVIAAKDAGLPVLLGLEVDYYRGEMGRVADLLSGYPFDVLLGSVHWVGTWMFDNLDDVAAVAEWDHRGTETAWREYVESLEELAATRTCDVLAHPDLVKVTGRIPGPSARTECHARIAEAARAAGMAAELSSAGLVKPVGEAYPAPDLLSRFVTSEVPLTIASDTHGAGRVGAENAALVAAAAEAGCTSIRGFRGRAGYDIPIDARGAVR